MKKLFSLLFVVASATYAFAWTYYVDPNIAYASEGGGSSWEDAVSPCTMGNSITSVEDGDTIFIKGGIIHIDQNTGDDPEYQGQSNVWKFKAAPKIYGGFDPADEGTVTKLPAYPTATPTIFDGDGNDDGKGGDAKDAPMLIRIDCSDAYKSWKKTTIQGITFRNTFIEYDPSIDEKDVQTSLMEMSALRLICVQATVKNCEFYNHVTRANRGSQALTATGTRLHLIDCNLHDCISLSRGALLRMRSFYPTKVETDTWDGDCVLERCAFYNANSMGGSTTFDAKGEYGGAVHMSGGACFAINCTFVCDTNYSKGAGIRPNASGVTLVSCTMGHNYGARIDDPSQSASEGGANKQCMYGSCLGMDNASKLQVMNTIIVEDFDKYKKIYAPIYSDGDKNPTDITKAFTSGGYNILGSVWYIADGSTVDQSKLWLATDSVTLSSKRIYKFTEFFGTIDKFQDNGGCSPTILPLKMQNGASVAELQEFCDEWCPYWTSVDASVDQRGFKRDANVTCVGAAAYECSTALPETQSSISNQPSAIYNILGQPVGENYKGIVIMKGQKFLIQ